MGEINARVGNDIVKGVKNDEEFINDSGEILIN